MYLHVLATGSSGNCYVLSHDGDRLMLEAGIPADKLYKGVGHDLAPFHGVLISHAHKDHCKAVPDLQKSFLDLYMSEETRQAIDIQHTPNVFLMYSGTQTAGNWLVTSFPTEHDTPGSLGFYIKHTGADENILYLTDTGYCRFNPLHITTLIVECNYMDSIIDERKAVLDERYRRLLKYHMSLERLLEYLNKIDRSMLRDIILVHLSDNNSDEKKMVDAVKEATGVTVHAARPGESYCLDEYPFKG